MEPYLLFSKKIQSKVETPESLASIFSVTKEENENCYKLALKHFSSFFENPLDSSISTTNISKSTSETVTTSPSNSTSENVTFAGKPLPKTFIKKDFDNNLKTYHVTKKFL